MTTLETPHRTPRRGRRRDRRLRLLRPGHGDPARARPASRTSWCSSAARRSAAPGGSTRIRAAAATCPRTCTPSRSRPTPTGRAPTPGSPRSRPTCGASPTRLRHRALHSASAPPSRAPHWDEDARRWTSRPRGRAARPRARSPPPGALSDPKTPDIPGLERFEGRMFHSAQWDHDYDVTGKRVAAIGTGASAIQFVPAIAPEGRAAARLPAHGAVDHAPLRPADLRASSGACTGASRCCSGCSAAGSTRAASCSCSASSSSRGS